MQKFVWVYLAIAVGIVAAGWFFYVHEQRTVTQSVERTQTSSQVIVVQPRKSDEELRKEIEGIGSIKKLQPVPLPSSPQRQGEK